MSRRRLTRRGWTNGQWADVDVRVDRAGVGDAVHLNQLDGARVRTGICAECTYSPLTVSDDLLVCPNCGVVFKILPDEVVEYV